MGIYVEVNGVQYPASITGRLEDKEWDNRASKAIRLEATYEEVLSTFVDDVAWSIVQDVEDQVASENENGELVFETVMKTEIYDNSEYNIAGDIINHRDGTVTVKMGKPTAAEILAMIEEGLEL
jgi:hypothetical protein